jgi:hypothetical protein
MPSTTPLDICGRRRSPATLSDFHQGRPPRNKGLRYPADPPTVEEIIAVMRAAGEDANAVRLRGLIVVLGRRTTRQRSAHADRERPRPRPRRDPGPLRQGRQASRSAAGARSQLHVAALGCAAGSHRTSCAMRTRWRCRVRVCRCWSSSASSATPTSGSPRRTCGGSTTQRSSARSMSVRHR